jgi:hypothetical protein
MRTSFPKEAGLSVGTRSLPHRSVYREKTRSRRTDCELLLQFSCSLRGFSSLPLYSLAEILTTALQKPVSPSLTFLLHLPFFEPQ